VGYAKQRSADGEVDRCAEAFPVGSPFNRQQMDEVMARFGVLPLNNPPHFPRYNGGIEKGIRDFKSALAQRQSHRTSVPMDLVLAVEVTAHELNHRRRRCLRGRTACAVFPEDAQRLRWNQRQRQTSFRLLLHKFGAMIGKPTKGTHPSAAALWRVTVESWLRCQGLIAVRQNQIRKVSPAFPNIWSPNMTNQTEPQRDPVCSGSVPNYSSSSL
jgi:hypothetical protein